MRVFVDTGAFVGPALPRDQYHGESMRIWAHLPGTGIRLFSSEAVFQETMGFLHRAGTNFALKWAESQLGGAAITWLPVDAQVRRAALPWMRKFADQGVSFVDATSFALMRREKLQHVFSFDRHFAAGGFRSLRE